MKLPNCELANVSESKIAGYLLSRSHLHGRYKAAFFGRLGFSAQRWQELAEAVVLHAMRNDVMKVEDSPFGTRYVQKVCYGDPAEEPARFGPSGSSKADGRSHNS